MPISSPFNPASPQALATAHLFEFVLWLGAAVFVIVAGWVVLAAIRYRARPGRGQPPQDEGKPKVEIAWTVAAALVLLAIFIPTVITMGIVEPPVGSRRPDLVVIGHQWWWEVRYPPAAVVTANEIHIPIGRPLLVHLESTDVIHDFWVPQLARKLDMTPGRPNDLWLQATAPGVYLGACVEFCGTEHAWMRLRVIAEAPQAFAAWLSGQQAQAPAPASPEAIAGMALFRELTCDNCHATGVAIGPDLAHLATRQTLGAGVLANTPENLARWLANPQAVKPGVLMPDFRLTPAQIRQLVAYLETRR
jgi:cytochrome c oxidase subunit 2